MAHQKHNGKRTEVPDVQEHSAAEQSARAAQRLSVLGEMTGGIAHDFRNILAVVDSGLRLAEQNIGDPDKIRTFVAGVWDGVAYSSGPVTTTTE